MITPQYIAGFIDGEACIYIHRQKARKIWEYNHSLSIRTVNEHRGVLEQMAQLYGGKVTTINNPHDNGKTYYEHRLNGNKAYKLLVDVEPHLVIKKEQSRLVLDNWESIKPKKGGVPTKVNITEEDYAIRDKVYLELRELKQNVWDNRESLTYS